MASPRKSAAVGLRLLPVGSVTPLRAWEARTPTGRRLQLAALLRYLRTTAGLTQAQAGRSAWPTLRDPANKLNMIEKAERPIEPPSALPKLLETYRVRDPALRELASRLCEGSSQRGRWRGVRATHDRALRPYVDLEEDALVIRCVVSEQLPDQLQSPAYMAADFAGLDDTRAAADELRARQLRQANVILREDDPPDVYAVLSESCLRRVQGNDPAIMAEQLRFLLELEELPHVTLQIVPFHRPGVTVPRRISAISAQGIHERFALLRLTVPEVADEARHLDFAFAKTGDELVWTGSVSHYENLWNRALAAALRPAETRPFLEKVLRDFG